jgi:hypothetical protein
MVVAHAAHLLLKPLCDLGPIETVLAADLLARDLSPLGHSFYTPHVGSQHAGDFLDRQSSVGHTQELIIDD